VDVLGGHSVYWPRPSMYLVCVSVCLFVPRRIPTLLHGSGCNLGNDRGFPLVVQYWADLQSVHGFRCYDNIYVCKLIALYTANAHSAEREISPSACTRCVASLPIASLLSCNCSACEKDHN